MSHHEKLASYEKKLDGRSAEEIVAWSLETFGRDRVALASSLSIEDQVLTHLLLSQKPDARVFTLDTGRLHQETYRTIQSTMRRYGMSYEVLFPEASDVERLVREHGPDLFYESIELRKRCCEVRKVLPLRRILKGLDAWICGLRAGQSATRTRTKLIEWDNANSLFKINPLASWSTSDVWNFIRLNNVPFNVLQEKGYPSIGCLPCTRAIGDGEDLRAGRWWWETPEHKECGLHPRQP